MKSKIYCTADMKPASWWQKRRNEPLLNVLIGAIGMTAWLAFCYFLGAIRG